MSDPLRELKCPLCGAYGGHHHWKCGKATTNDLRQVIKYLEEKNKSTSEYTQKAHERAILWEGKYRIVCHENNKLRKKLYNTEKE